MEIEESVLKTVIALTCNYLSTIDLANLSMTSSLTYKIVKSHFNTRRKDISLGLEPYPISCKNDIDKDLHPKNFIYITKSILPTTHLNGYRSSSSSLSLSLDLGVPLYLEKDKNKGWCVKSKDYIDKGRFICESIGEIITSAEAHKRLEEYDNNPIISHALFIIREILPSKKSILRTNIDSTKIGNLARYFNHSCDGGNVKCEIERDNYQDNEKEDLYIQFLPKLRFYAIKNIIPNEELTFSYVSNFNEKITLSSKPCFCNTKQCQGWLPSLL